MGIGANIAKAVSAAVERARGTGRDGSGGGRVVPMEVAVQAPPPPGADVDGWFGPGNPPSPSAPADVAGRRFDYPVGANMLQRPRAYEPVGFDELRALADGYDLLRIVIETRKDQMSRLTWNFSPRDPKAKMEAGELATRAKKYEDFFRRPDGESFWGDWLRNVLEDLLVIDAPAVHVRRTRGGDIYSLDQVDGATIKRIVDDGGRTPPPPFAAYQQVLKGMPAVNYSKADLIYRPRNMRVHKLYGFSPVEQIIMTVNIALRRQMWQLAYFTHGNIPDSLIGVPATWTPDQIRQFQDWFDSLLLGNVQDRRSARFVPGEVAKSYVPTKEAEIFGAAEEWMARVVCFCFGISHQALVKEVNRATAETAKEQALMDGMAPIMNWVKGLVDSILIDLFDETELEFSWLDEKELDPKAQAEILNTLTGKIQTINESREALGLDPDKSPEANMLGSFSADGTFVPLSTEEAIKLKQQMQEAFPPPPALDPSNPDAGNNEEGQGSAGVAAPAEGEADSGAIGGSAKLSAAHRHVYKALPKTSPLRPRAVRIRKSLQKRIAAVLADVGRTVSAQVQQMLNDRGFRKADETNEPLTEAEIAAIAKAAMEAADLSGLDVIMDVTREDLEAIAADAGRQALAQIGAMDHADLVDRVSERAVEYARDRSAELIGKRVLADGSIIDNPNPEWAITDSTRDMIGETITTTLEDNLGSDALIQALEDSFAFSPERAEMVSRTEIAMANSEAAMASFRDAQADGVGVKKEWILGPNPCDICEENADAGPIEMDEDFPSGDDTVPAHPNCECAVVGVVEDASGDSTEEEN